MLVAENADNASAAEQFDGAMKSFAAIEKFDSGAGARATNMCVDVAVAELLVNGAGANVIEIVRE